MNIIKKLASEIIAKTFIKKKPYISVHPAEILTEDVEEKLYRSLESTGDFIVDFGDGAIYFENVADVKRLFPEIQRELGMNSVKIIDGTDDEEKWLLEDTTKK